MRKLLFGLGYFLLFLTPMAIGITLWVFGIIFVTDHSLMSLSMQVFMQENLDILRVWLYSWFWKDVLDLIWSYPAAVVVSLNLVINTWLGFFSLRLARAIPKPRDRRY
jgi:hypothetical protein